MAELAGLFLGVAGILPVMVEIIKAYKDVRKGIISVISCARELKLIELDLKVQERRFLNELEILLQQVVRNERARDMIEDTTHPFWHDRNIEDNIRESLDRSYSLCAEIVDSIKASLQELSESLAIFEKIRDQRQKGESLRKTFNRLRAALKFDRGEYDRHLDRLRKGNEDLEALRGQAAVLEQCEVQVAHPELRNRMPSYISTNQTLSSRAYATLAASFKCNDVAHAQHLAALSLDGGWSERLHLDIAIYYISAGLKKNRLYQPLRFLLQLRQLNQIYSLSTLRPSPSGLESAPLSMSQRIHNKTKLCDNDEGRVTCLQFEPEEKRKAEQRNFPEGDSMSSKRIITETLTAREESTEATINLSHIESTCHYLRQKCVRCLQESDNSHTVIGYFEPVHNPDYLFYVSAKRHEQSQFSIISDPEFAVSLDKMLNEQKEVVTNLHQYKIALKLVMAVIQYNSTPWLREFWELSDLLLHCSKDSFPEDVPLSLQSRLVKPSSAMDLSASLNDTCGNHNQFDSQLKYHRGIRNMFTFSLGVALLELAYMKSLSDLRTDADEDEIDTARRVADTNNIGLSRLGKGYQEIVRKCLNCDFGCGSDLGKPELREAIYNGIAHPLQEVIEKLEKLGI